MTITFAEIKARYEHERANHQKPTTRDDLPFTYETITPGWLSTVLAHGHRGAAVLSHTLGPVDDGTSNRRRIALEWNAAGVAAGLPDKLFCKGTQSLESRYMLGMNEGVQAEVNFYNLVRPTLAVIAPLALFARFDPRTLNSLIIMRDMKDEVDFCRLETDLSFAHAQSQMRLFATLHARYYQSAELDTTLAAFSRWEDFFTITCVDAGFTDACIRGFTMAEAVIPPRLFRREAEVWPATLRCTELHRTLPRGLNHSDVHLKNWYITPAGEMGINDWQNAAKGNGGRDLAYCLGTSLSIEKRRLWERDLITYYCEEFTRAGGPKLDVDTTFLRYRQQMFAALAWWTGTLGQPPDAPAMQPAETSLEFIKRMATAIDDLDCLDSV
jgi:Ecdysteroid kinase-like family